MSKVTLLYGHPKNPQEFERYYAEKHLPLAAKMKGMDRPGEASLQLDTSSVTVSVTGRFVPLSPDRTRLLSEEVFRFKGLYNKLFGYLARGAITKAHRRHMEAFKRFAESRVGA